MCVHIHVHAHTHTGVSGGIKETSGGKESLSILTDFCYVYKYMKKRW